MTAETKKALHNLKRRMGKERARYHRFYKNAKERNDGLNANRAWYEMTAVTLCMGLVNDELRKLEAPREQA